MVVTATVLLSCAVKRAVDNGAKQNLLPPSFRVGSDHIQDRVTPLLAVSDNKSPEDATPHPLCDNPNARTVVVKCFSIQIFSLTV